MATPRRRWFRFSLRTLFVVVTVLGCWLGYQLNWIRERHAVLARQSPGGGTGFWPGPRPGFLLQRLFREPGIGCIVVGECVSDAEFNRILSLFPEATVIRSHNDEDESESITVAPFISG